MGLGRDPVQARGVVTVQLAIDAAIELIGEKDVDRLRLTDVTQRSGVSNGSLMHHFGTRDGLVAAALAVRFDRAIAERIQQYDGLPGSADLLGPAVARMLVGTAEQERARTRRARFRALSFARHRPELRIALVASFRTAERQLADRMAIAQQAGLLVDGLASDALAVFAETYTSGRVLEGALIGPLPEAEWQGLFLAVLAAIVVPAVLDSAGASVAVTAEALPPLTRLTRPDIPTLALEGDERAVIDHAVEHLRTRSAATLLVRDVCAATGVTPSWFSRHFADRDDLVDLARSHVLAVTSRDAASILDRMFDEASTVEELRGRMARIIRRSQGPDFLTVAWARLDLIVAAPDRTRLIEEAGVIVAAALARTTDAIAGAQQRGLVRPDVSAGVMARFLWGFPLAFLLADLMEVPSAVVHDLADRTFATLLAER